MESDIPMGLEMVDTTTSKLGADMLTKEQIAAITDTYARRWNTTAAWNVKRCIENALIDALALLARQPAAIDKQKTPPFVMCLHDVVEMWNSTTADSFEDELMEFAVKAINFYKDTLPGSAAPLANEASKPAVPISLEQIKALETAVCNGQSGEALRLLHHMRNALAAPSVEQDERGEDEDDYQPTPESERAAFNAMMRWHLIRMLQAWRYGGDLRAVGMAAFEWARSNDVGKEAFKASEKAVKIAASTSANVAQYRNEALSALLVDHSHAASAKDVDAVLKARDAIYSMFANVAQGAEAELEFMPVESMQHAIVYGSKEAIAALKARMERDYRIASLVPVPPAQTALTDDARDAIRSAALKEAANLCAIVSTDANRRRKTSDNPTYMEGKSDGAEDCETRILRMIDAALTAAQPASGETK
jgi:hypothetical protein